MKLGYVIPHEIRIKASANMGFIVKIGCGEYVAVNADDLLKGLTEYLGAPKKWEEEYNKLPGGPEVITTGPTPEAPLTPGTERDQTA